MPSLQSAHKHTLFLTLKGTEITSVIQQWKEMNCEAGSINTMDQGRERDTRAAKEFWKNLGGKSPVKGNFVALIHSKGFNIYSKGYPN